MSRDYISINKSSVMTQAFAFYTNKSYKINN